MTDLELHWLAGWLEGEGTFYFQPQRNCLSIQAFSVDKDVIEKAARIAEGGVYFIKPRFHVAGGWDSQAGWRLSLERKAAADLIYRLLPFMGSRRREQMQKALDGWENRSNKPIEKPCACGCGRTVFGGPRVKHARQSACGQRAYRQRKAATA